MPATLALAHSVQPAYLPDGRTLIMKTGYVDITYDTRIKKVNYVQVYYPCRAAGPAHSKYPSYLSLSPKTLFAPMPGGRASGMFTQTLTTDDAPKVGGDTATVTWKVSGVKISTAGLSGSLAVTVSGPKTICPFSFSGKKLVPLLDLPGNS